MCRVVLRLYVVSFELFLCGCDVCGARLASVCDFVCVYGFLLLYGTA